MYANRISYWIDGKGPSYALDLACASSAACLEHAYRSISTGQCDAAIVGGCNLCMHPSISLNFRRIYSEVYHAKANYSLKNEAQFSPIRHPKDIEDFLEAFYSEIDVSPKDVEYIEGHGSANAEADGNELQAIGKVFAKDNSIKVGSVVSNMGHSEPASGVCALTKLCLAYHKGELPANLHYSQPQEHIPSVKEGKIEVLQQNVPFKRGFTALNSFSYSGANIHVLLKGHYKKKDPERYKTSIPRIVLASGRQEECVMKIFNILKNQSVDPEQVGLLHNIHEKDIPGHMCRGYVVLDTNEKKETVSLSQNTGHYPGRVRPIWFVYSGMGSQWATMGAGLMRIPIFAAAIEKCCRVLEPKGIDLVKILTEPDNTIYDNILHSFVGIAAVQIGLTDILKQMGIIPDNIIGHSVGELGCAYADGCFTAEEMILSAYSRGLVSIQTPFIKGSMAAVGLGYKSVLPMCPPEVEVACHNSSESSTISGPADIMKEFVGELTKQRVFAKEVPCPALMKYLSKVITEPKERSPKWVSTSVPQNEWDTPKAKLSSAEYHTNNLLNSVLFEETSKLIPEDAIVIEIAPHGLLQAIMKRSLSGCTHIPLTRKGNQDPVKYLLEAIGKLYVAGVNPKVDILYPKIEYPVSTETSLLSHFVYWEHSENWPEARFNTKEKVVATSRVFVMSIHDDDYKYLQGHIRDGVHVFPEAALLVLVWETLAMYLNVNYRDQPVSMKNIQFYSEAIIDTEKPLRLHIMIYKGNNAFEVSCESVKIASGTIIPLNSQEIIFRPLEETKPTPTDISLTRTDFYKIMELRGFSYRDKFQSIHTADSNRLRVNIKWTDDWIILLDGLIQFNLFQKDHEGVSIPKIIRKLTIDPSKHVIDQTSDEATQKAEIYEFYNLTRCDGVEMEQIEFLNMPVKEKHPDVLMTQTFIPHFLTGILKLDVALQINMQIVAENTPTNKLSVLNMLTEQSYFVTKALDEAAKNNVLFDVIVDKIKPETIQLNTLLAKEQVLKNSNVFIVDNLLGDEKGQWGGYYYLPSETSLKLQNATLNTVIPGNLDSLTWVEMPPSLPSGNLVKVNYSALSLKDVKKALGQSIEDNRSFGMDFSGINNKGERVMGITPNGAISCTVEADPNLTWLVPKHWTLEDAATVPLPYIHAFYCLIVRNRIHPNIKNKRIFINGGAGALGQAVISICLAANCTIFTCVSDLRKKMFLMKLFPDLKDKNIGYSRDGSFQDMVQVNTEGKGCDYVINCATGVLRQAAMKCAGKDATFIDVNDYDSKQNSDFGMFFLAGEKNYLNLRLSEIFKPENNLERELLNEASKLGPIHGIFFVQNLDDATENFDPVAVFKKFTDTAMVVANLDLMSRNICTELKYFVVLTGSSEKVTDEYAASVSEKICLIRSEVGLPALAFRIGKLNEITAPLSCVAEADFQSNSQLLSYSAIFNALETSLKLNYKNVQAFNLKKRPDSDFLGKIEKILGISNINSIPENLTLEDLSANDYNIEEIIIVIKNEFKLNYPLEKAKKITIGELLKLKDHNIEKNKFKSGLGAFFTFIDNDECLATEPMITMQTKVLSAVEREEEFDKQAEYLMLIPGFEGHYQIFKSVCERLKIQAVAFQLGPDLANDTIQEMANNILKVRNKYFFTYTIIIYIHISHHHHHQPFYVPTAGAQAFLMDG
ncbi:unnamed protein product [Diatraea saccharalis]|uniref:Uncharacterized protein n=1 Tax=Diatraea saccharalis TaxID=40085 RepID=A0A9N9R2X5_9NEOP|nr:unnamed protein product [Diatraea saccharalis]